MPSRNNPNDPGLCDPRCPKGIRCYEGHCIGLDATITDGSGKDAAIDGDMFNLEAGSDGILADGPKLDAQTPDAQTTDAPTSDVQTSDVQTSDVSTPDVHTPDTPVIHDSTVDSPVQDFTIDSPTPDTTIDASITDADAGCLHPTVTQLCNNGWCHIPKGCFTMGSPTSESCRDSTKEAEHEVTLTHDFEISQKETTQTQFTTITGFSNPSYFSSCGSDCPVENLSWHDAADYCNQLSWNAGLTPCYSCMGMQPGGLSCSVVSPYNGSSLTIYDCPGYRLPTEAEWEYVYRAGTATPFYNGTNSSSACTTPCTQDTNASSIGWYCNNSGNQTKSVGQKTRNAWGLYDMAGNISEWIHDTYTQNLGTSAVTDPLHTGSGNRVIRGGNWESPAGELRAAFRGDHDPLLSAKSSKIGFRCVRTLNP